jgi:hypothetical protein
MTGAAKAPATATAIIFSFEIPSLNDFDIKGYLSILFCLGYPRK